MDFQTFGIACFILAYLIYSLRNTIITVDDVVRFKNKLEYHEDMIRTHGISSEGAAHYNELLEMKTDFQPLVQEVDQYKKGKNLYFLTTFFIFVFVSPVLFISNIFKIFKKS
ncbi:MAG: hypothetical protein ACRC5C_01795 [Bacilli bacterium]